MIPRHLFSSLRQPGQPRRAFSLVELAIVVAVVGLLAVVVIDAGIREWHREQVNGVLIDLSGWLENVRRSAIKGNRCQVTIHGNHHTNGSLLAEVAGCGNIPALRITGLTVQQAYRVEPSGLTQFTFTSAGTLFPAPAANAPIELRLSLADLPETGRCLQLDGLLGVISLGRSSRLGDCDLNESL